MPVPSFDQFEPPLFEMPCLGRQIADIPAYVTFHGLSDYISITKTTQTYDELYSDPNIEKAENQYKSLQTMEVQPPKLDRQIKHLDQSKSIEEMLKLHMKESNYEDSI
jgi:hypothetical protein